MVLIDKLPSDSHPGALVWVWAAFVDQPTALRMPQQGISIAAVQGAALPEGPAWHMAHARR